jgi:3D (Asp-Asp-Asp) domain-containing protein
MDLAKIGQKLEKLSKICKKIEAGLVRLSWRKTEVVVLAIILLEFLFPHVSLAQELKPEPSYRVATVMNELQWEDNTFGHATFDDLGNYLPLAADKQPQKVIWITVTAYSSTVDQCDSDPCTTANGYNLCANNIENVVAANFLPFGTAIKMPEYFGDRVFTVQDRMNARYDYRVDVWMKTREAARAFGVRYLKVEIY